MLRVGYGWELGRELDIFLLGAAGKCLDSTTSIASSKDAWHLFVDVQLG